MCPVLWKFIIGNHIDLPLKMSWPSLASPFSVSWGINGVKMYFIYCGLICIQLNVNYQLFVMKIIAILIFLNCHVFIKKISTNMRIVSQKIINHWLDGGKPKLMLKTCFMFLWKNTWRYKQVYQENDLTLMYSISRISNNNKYKKKQKLT